MNLQTIITKAQEKLNNLNMLTNVDIIIKPFGLCRAYFVPGRIVIHKFNPYLFGGNFTRMIDISMSSAKTTEQVIFHEFGHVFFYKNKSNYFFTSKFKEAFEENYSFDNEVHISRYAATSPEEDFSECFMTYAINPERNYYPDGIHRKINFIKHIFKEENKIEINTPVIK